MGLSLSTRSTGPHQTGASSQRAQTEERVQQTRADFEVPSLKRLLANRHEEGVTVRNVTDRLVCRRCVIATKWRIYELSTEPNGTVSITSTPKPVTNILQRLWQSITRIVSSGKNELERSLNDPVYGVAAVKQRAIDRIVGYANSRHSDMKRKYTDILNQERQNKTEEKIAQEESLAGKLSRLSDCIIASMKVANNTKQRMDRLYDVHISLADYVHGSLPSVLSSFVGGRSAEARNKLSQIITNHGEVLNSIPGVPEILGSLDRQLSDAAGIN